MLTMHLFAQHINRQSSDNSTQLFILVVIHWYSLFSVMYTATTGNLYQLFCAFELLQFVKQE